MNIETYFPQKLALGSNFCNRVDEQKQLRLNIQGVRPTLIMSPRRYGKTSLGVYVVEKLKLPYTHLDLFPLADVQDVQNTILGGIGEILASIESTPEKAMKAVSQFFSELSVRFNFIGSKIEVDLMQSKQESSKTLINALTQLDATLKKKKTKAVLFLDEFQRLGQMQDAELIEAALRHVAQKSTHVVFLFSGSNRHLLNAMFDDSHRPLYKLCDRLTLDRIEAKSYTDFINHLAKRTWKKELSDETLETIFSLTACHPYYVNVLCARLWRKNKYFTTKQVLSAWYDYAVEEKSNVFKELEGLSGNQLKLLIALARNVDIESPLGDKFLSLANMALSSARQSLNVLKQKDYVYHDREKHYRVLDPLIAYVLSERPD